MPDANEKRTRRPKNDPNLQYPCGDLKIFQKVLPISNILDLDKPVVLIVGFPPLVLSINVSSVQTAPLTAVPATWKLYEETDGQGFKLYTICKWNDTSQCLSVSTDTINTPLTLTPMATATRWRFMKHETGGLLLGRCTGTIDPISQKCSDGLCVASQAVVGQTLRLASFPVAFDRLSNWSILNLM